MATKKTTTKEAIKVVPTVLRKPLITEKAANGAQFSVYLFDVEVGATKSEIAKAFKAQYKQTPIKVNTVNVIRKSHFRRGRLGFGAKVKKAYVFLKKGTTISIA
ncbi:MAG: ribosomal protein [Candidatus Nomurabacteria bacterium]|nr:ribosomal protein [Candidatus Nomurabacteria bacterium]